MQVTGVEAVRGPDRWMLVKTLMMRRLGAAEQHLYNVFVSACWLHSTNYFIAKNCWSVTATEACTEACRSLTVRVCQHKESLFHRLPRGVALSDKNFYFPQSGINCAMWHNYALNVYYGTLWLTVSVYTYYVWMFTYASLHDLSCL